MQESSRILASGCRTLQHRADIPRTQYLDQQTKLNTESV